MKQKKAASRLDEFYLTDTLKWSCCKRESTAASVSDGSLHNLLCYLRQFHLFLKREPAPDCVALLSYHVFRKMSVRSYVTDDELCRIMEQIDTKTAREKRDKRRW